ncbi:hypothetical protein [Streptomyces sp. KLOTTS4A1]|uniref:hypothetical protein n=1 Tax=Streptomyces sp. KLOTTS4A1 TaxID=3390996 RepID=UPI0039F62976
MESVTAELLMALAGGSAGAAGHQAWEGLRALVRRRSSARDEQPQSAEGELMAFEGAPEDADRARELVVALRLRARQDPEFAEELAAWGTTAPRVRTGSGDVHNEISGGTQETVIQARDINGTIDFG